MCLPLLNIRKQLRFFVFPGSKWPADEPADDFILPIAPLRSIVGDSASRFEVPPAGGTRPSVWTGLTGAPATAPTIRFELPQIPLHSTLFIAERMSAGDRTCDDETAGTPSGARTATKQIARSGAMRSSSTNHLSIKRTVHPHHDGTHGGMNV